MWQNSAASPSFELEDAMFDYSLYLVTDRALSRGRAICEIVREAIAGGVIGISVDNAAEVMQAGADGGAVVSAIVAASCPRTAAAVLKKQLQGKKQKDKQL
jgi:thiamine monophosphate synthase